MDIWNKIKSFFSGSNKKTSTIISPITNKDFIAILQDETRLQEKIFLEKRLANIEKMIHQNFLMLKINVLQQQKNEELIINLTTAVEELLNDVQKLAEVINKIVVNVTYVESIADLDQTELEEILLSTAKKGILN